MRFIFCIHWDDQHRSPWFGPYDTQTEREAEMKAVRAVYRKAGRVPPRLEVCRLDPPGRAAAIVGRNALSMRPKVKPGTEENRQAGIRRATQEQKRVAAERRRLVVTAIARLETGFSRAHAEAIVQSEVAKRFYAYELGIHQLPRDPSAILRELVRDGILTAVRDTTRNGKPYIYHFTE
jgi:hypothetical protein